MPQNYVRVYRRRTEPVEELEPPCAHLGAVTSLPEPAVHACAECVELDEDWVHLRMCLDCGSVACCDTSRYKHATKHNATTGHPVMRGIELGDRWIYCYEDRETMHLKETQT
jgi:uncharacterized UBP type Zn finger protein